MYWPNAKKSEYNPTLRVFNKKKIQVSEFFRGIYLSKFKLGPC